MRIVADSSCDLTSDLRNRLPITLVPLTISFGDQSYVDNDDLDVSAMLNAMGASPHPPRSACPSPQDFMDAFMEQGSVFVVTMTAALSGTYNSAMTARDLFLHDISEKFIHVFDSKGSSARETLIALKIDELINQKLNEETIVEMVNDYIEHMKYIFQLGSLDAMIKNGRLSKLKGFVANAFGIKPILKASPEGEVELLENVRTEKKSMQRLVDIIGEQCSDFSDRIIGISHCEALEKAEALKVLIAEKYDFKEILIVPTRGLSSTYVQRGGITIAF